MLFNWTTHGRNFQSIAQFSILSDKDFSSRKGMKNLKKRFNHLDVKPDDFDLEEVEVFLKKEGVIPSEEKKEEVVIKNPLPKRAIDERLRFTVKGTKLSDAEVVGIAKAKKAAHQKAKFEEKRTRNENAKRRVQERNKKREVQFAELPLGAFEPEEVKETPRVRCPSKADVVKVERAARKEHNVAVRAANDLNKLAKKKRKQQRRSERAGLVECEALYDFIDGTHEVPVYEVIEATNIIPAPVKPYDFYETALMRVKGFFPLCERNPFVCQWHKKPLMNVVNWSLLEAYQALDESSYRVLGINPDDEKHIDSFTTTYEESGVDNVVCEMEGFAMAYQEGTNLFRKGVYDFQDNVQQSGYDETKIQNEVLAGKGKNVYRFGSHAKAGVIEQKQPSVEHITFMMEHKYRFVRNNSFVSEEKITDVLKNGTYRDYADELGLMELKEKILNDPEWRSKLELTDEVIGWIMCMYLLYNEPKYTNRMMILHLFMGSINISLENKYKAQAIYAVANGFSALFDRKERVIETEALSDHLSDLAMMMKSVTTSSVAEAVRNFFLTTAALKWLPTDKAADVHKYFGKLDNCDMFTIVTILLESMATLVRVAEGVAAGLPMSSLLFSRDPVQEALLKGKRLLAVKDSLYTGLPVPGMMCQKQFVSECEAVLPILNKVINVSNPFKGAYKACYELYNNLYPACQAVKTRVKASVRSPPFCIVLHGEPGVGKSTLMSFLFRIFSDVKGRKYDESHVFHRISSSDYWEGYDPWSNPFVHYSELGNKNRNLAKTQGDECIQELTSVIDSVAMPLNMAFGDKGKIFFMGELVLIDTNTPDMNLDLLFANPAAFRRRFLYINPTVLKDCRKDIGPGIDFYKSKDRRLNDKHTFNVYRKEQLNNIESSTEMFLKDCNADDLYDWLFKFFQDGIAREDELVRMKNDDVDVKYGSIEREVPSEEIYDFQKKTKSVDLDLNIMKDYVTKVFCNGKEKMVSVVGAGISTRSKEEAIESLPDISDEEIIQSMHDESKAAIDEYGSMSNIELFASKEASRRLDSYLPGVEFKFLKNLIRSDILHGIYTPDTTYAQYVSLTEKPIVLPEGEADRILFPISEEKEMNANVETEGYIETLVFRMSVSLIWRLYFQNGLIYFWNVWCCFSHFCFISSIEIFGHERLKKQILPMKKMVYAIVLFLHWGFFTYHLYYGFFSLFCWLWFLDGLFDYLMMEQIAIERTNAFESLQYSLVRARGYLKRTNTDIWGKDFKYHRRYVMYSVAGISFVALLKMYFKNTVRTEGSTQFTFSNEDTVKVNKFEEESECEGSIQRIKGATPERWVVKTLKHPIVHTGDAAALSQAVMQNVRKVWVKSEDSLTSVHIIGLKQDYALINTHALPKDGSFVVQVGMAHVDKEGTFKEVYVTPRYRKDLGQDVSILRLSSLQFKDITKHLNDVEFNQANGKVGMTTAFIIRTRVPIVARNAKHGDIIISDPLAYDWSSHKKGLCGFPIVVSVGQGAALVGMHYAANTEGTDAYGCRLFKDKIELALVEMGEASTLMPITSQSDEMKSLADPVSRSPFMYEELDNLEFLGYDGVGIMPFSKSKLRKSVLHQDLSSLFEDCINFRSQSVFLPPMMRPVVKADGEWVSPYNVNLRKIAVQKKSLNKDILEDCVNFWLNDVLANLKTKGRTVVKPLELKVAINGDDKDFYLRRINAATGAGYGFKGKKNLWLPISYEDEVRVEREPTSELLAKISFKMEEYARFQSSGSVFGAKLKDEPRLAEKVFKGKTRMFFPAPVDLLIVSRMYLAPIFTTMVEFNDIFNTSVGIDMHTEGGALYQKFEDFSDAEYCLFDGDYGGFDTSMPYEIGLAASSFVYRLAEKLGYNDTALTMLSGVLSDNLFPHVEVNGDVFIAAGLMTSGSYGTAEFNCVRNNLLLMYYFASTPGLTLQDYKDNFLKTTYGDDVTGVVKSSISHLFNNVLYAEFCERVYGMEFTTPSKEKVVTPLRSLKEMNFLKRNFVVHPEYNCIKATLDMESIYRMLYWTMPSDKVTSADQLFATCNSALWELFLHLTREQWENFKIKLCDIISKSIEGFQPSFLVSYNRICAVLQPDAMILKAEEVSQASLYDGPKVVNVRGYEEFGDLDY